MKHDRQESCCVVGGGVLGQVLALRLHAAGKRVTLCEAAPRTGGLAAAWEIDGIVWDKFYHVILPFDRHTLALLEELGLDREIVWARSRTGFFADGRLAPLDGAADYLRLPFIGALAKVRLAFTLAIAARIRDGRRLERIPVQDWLIRWSGREAFERIWRPLLRAKLGSNDNITSAAFIWASIRRLYLARSSGAKNETLGFVDGGYARIFDALQRRLDDAGVTVLTDCPVRQIRREGETLRVATAHGEMLFDQVVSTLPTPVTGRICPDFDHQFRSRLEGVVYQGVICASVVLDRPLHGCYLTYLTDSDLPFTAVVEMSALTGRARFGGRSLVYLPRYVTADDAYWSLDDREVRERFLAGLKCVIPDLKAEQISAFRLTRVRHVMRVPTVGETNFVPPVTTDVPGLHVVSSAQIVDGTLNVDATLALIDKAMPALLAAQRRKAA